MSIVISSGACGRSDPPPPPPAGDAALSRVSDAARAADAVAPTDAAPARPAAPGDLVVVTDRAIPGRWLAAAPGGATRLAALEGVRFALHGDDGAGPRCEATIGPVVTGERCLAYTGAAAELVDLSGDCAGAIVGVPPGERLLATRVAAVPADLDALVLEAFDGHTGRMADEKAALEELPEAAEVVSSRLLALGGAAPLVLVYARIHGARSIDVYRIRGDGDARAAEPLETLRAPAPSRVIGADLDGDGAVDAVIAHDAGVHLITGDRDNVDLACYR